MRSEAVDALPTIVCRFERLRYGYRLGKVWNARGAKLFQQKILETAHQGTTAAQGSGWHSTKPPERYAKAFKRLRHVHPQLTLFIRPQQVRMIRRHLNRYLPALVRTCAVWSLLLLSASVAAGAGGMSAGFGKANITPDVHQQAVWIAGYGHGRRAETVHDPLWARAVVFEHAGKRMAWVSVDLIGLPYAVVQQIRSQLKNFDYVLVASTHNHEGPDTIGIWGSNPWTTGVDARYTQQLVAGCVAAVRTAEKELAATKAHYGTAEEPELLHDSRQPKVLDPVLRVLRFDAQEAGDASEVKPLGIVVQWNSHPEALGPRNTALTADFPAATVAWLEAKYRCPVVYFSGAVGGLMSPPDGCVQDEDGNPLGEGDFRFADAYGVRVAEVAHQAIEQSQPIQLTPWVVAAKPIAIPLINPVYKLARAMGVIRREGRAWSGDVDQLGEPITAANAQLPFAVETEVAYLRLGGLHVVAMPGELYPELMYGNVQDPAEANADYADAPVEPSIRELLPKDAKLLMLGLANDEIGYIIPKRQWIKTTVCLRTAAFAIRRNQQRRARCRPAVDGSPRAAHSRSFAIATV